MLFYHEAKYHKIGDEIFNTAILKYFKMKYGATFLYKDVNPYISAIEFFPDDLAVFCADNFYGNAVFNPHCIWFWNQMLKDKKIFSCSKIKYDLSLVDIDLVFVPLLHPAYNEPRGMKIEMAYEFVLYILDNFDNSKIIIDAHKRHILNLDHPNVIYSKDINEAFDYIKRSKIYVGGDTGTTHFAGSINHPQMILFYPDEKLTDDKFGESCRQVICNLFDEPEIMNYQYSSLPCCDPKNYQVIQMVANEISKRQFLEALEKTKTKPT